MIWTDIISWIFLSLGSFFVVVGAIGMVRFPDIFTRMHATSIVDTTGAGFLLVGMMFQVEFGLVTFKLFVLLLLFFFITPVASHALARAALQAGVKPKLGANLEEEKH